MEGTVCQNFELDPSFILCKKKTENFFTIFCKLIF